ncbi:GNAT family N-acetyltransferase [Deinococcus sp. KSM4-11]|uniref:GNAT family N-acetyltransferase n=1 Tax=Deinococcus sp. KSM4-11 TaxID=2568654 RepID=UPI0010A34293|nr:GNAT family protein [Deinococcus sp. KSM4-11]THF88932.1 GNAT family N-acetyltransferase [Deinococcus sp. KSM4-11]
MSSPALLSGPRVILRSLLPEDADVLCAYRNDAAVAAFQGWTVPYRLADARTLIQDMTGKRLGDPGWVQYGIALPDGRLLGDVALRTHGAQAEFGITLAPSAQGQGYAGEAGAVLVTHAFTVLNLHRLHASIDPRNGPVARLLLRLGFRHEGTLIQAYDHRGEWTDDALYGLLHRDWLDRPAR